MRIQLPCRNRRLGGGGQKQTELHRKYKITSIYMQETLQTDEDFPRNWKENDEEDSFDYQKLKGYTGFLLLLLFFCLCFCFRLVAFLMSKTKVKGLRIHPLVLKKLNKCKGLVTIKVRILVLMGKGQMWMGGGTWKTGLFEPEPIS